MAEHNNVMVAGDVMLEEMVIAHEPTSPPSSNRLKTYDISRVRNTTDKSYIYGPFRLHTPMCVITEVIQSSNGKCSVVLTCNDPVWQAMIQRVDKHIINHFANDENDAEMLALRYLSPSKTQSRVKMILGMEDQLDDVAVFDKTYNRIEMLSINDFEQLKGAKVAVIADLKKIWASCSASNKRPSWFGAQWKVVQMLIAEPAPSSQAFVSKILQI